MRAHGLGAAGIGAVFLCVVLSGCAAPSRPEAGETRVEGVPEALSASLGAVQPVDALASGEVWVPVPSERRFLYTRDSETGPVTHRIAEAGEDGLTVSWVDAGSGAVLSSQSLTLAGGAVASAASENPDRDALSRFRPPLVVLSARLAVGEPFRQDVEIAVSDPDRPKRIKHRGSGTNVVELVGKAPVALDRGSVVCVVVRTTFEATFGPARVHRVSHRWYEPGVGLIAEHAHEVVRTLGIETENRLETWVVAE